MVKEKQKGIQDIPAFLFMLMVWRVLPAKTVALFAGGSGESLAMGAVVILSVLIYAWHLFIHLHGKLPGGKALLVPLIGLIVLGGSVLFHANEWNTLYLTYYVRYVFFTLIFLISVRDYQYLVDLYSKFALVTFLILGWQPIVSTNVFASWMDYGFTIALPCTIGLYALAKKKKNVLYWSLTVASFFLAIAFANRSTWICIVLFIALYELILEKGTVKKFGFLALTFIAVLLVAYNFEAILNWLIDLNNRFNYNSHSLQKFRLLLNGTTFDIFMSGRQGLSNLATKEIAASFPFGSGVGHFESQTGIYSHNIAFDLLLYWGLFGAFFGIIAFVGIFRSAVKEENRALKTFKIIMICMWFPKLFFSGTFTYEIAFWAGITLMFALPIDVQNETEVDPIMMSEGERETW